MSFSGMLIADDANDRITQDPDGEAREFSDRREFLGSLGKWSTAAIAAILLCESAPDQEATPNGEGWNQGGRGWPSSRGGGGSWVNRRGW